MDLMAIVLPPVEFRALVLLISVPVCVVLA